MRITSQNLVTTYSNPHISFYLKSPNLQIPNFNFTTSTHSQTPKTISITPFHHQSIHTQRSTLIKAYESDRAVDREYLVAANSINFDAFLLISELFCLASSAFLFIVFVINTTFSTSQKPVLVLEWIGNRAWGWQCLLLVSGNLIGSAFRRRQWRRICVGFDKPGSLDVNLVERIEKVEEELRSSATIIRLLSRHLEKLGFRFRVMRKSMKEPIAEAAALAQKNSEATRSLAVQEELLEKELAEIQKVLLAMQDQQQKQLELILAIVKSGKLREINQGTSQDEKKIETNNSTDEEVKQTETNQIQAFAHGKEANNDSIAI